MQNKLNKTYRTAMCAHATTGSSCPYGGSCEHAHSPSELRADAAIALGVLPADYKTSFCNNVFQPGGDRRMRRLP